MDNNLEKLFKTALEEVTVDPPARVWTGINSRLGGKQNRFRQLFIYSGAAAAIVLLLSSLFMLQQEKKKTSYPPLVKTQSLKPRPPISWHITRQSRTFLRLPAEKSKNPEHRNSSRSIR